MKSFTFDFYLSSWLPCEYYAGSCRVLSRSAKRAHAAALRFFPDEHFVLGDVRILSIR